MSIGLAIVRSGGCSTLVITRRAHRPVRDADRTDQLLAWIVLCFNFWSRMIDPNRPRYTSRIRSAQIEIAACVDREISKGMQLAHRHVHREPLHHSPKIENQGPQ